MPTFNMAAQTPNGQPGGTETTVYPNGMPQTFPGREYFPTFHFLKLNLVFQFLLLL